MSEDPVGSSLDPAESDIVDHLADALLLAGVFAFIGALAGVIPLLVGGGLLVVGMVADELRQPWSPFLVVLIVFVAIPVACVLGWAIRLRDFIRGVSR